MPRRKTTLLTDGSPPATNQAEDTNSDSLKTGDRPNKRRKTSVSSVAEHGGEGSGDMDRKLRQTRSSGSSQPTSRKASILSRAATETSSSVSAAATAAAATTTAAAAAATTTAAVAVSFAHIEDAVKPASLEATFQNEPNFAPSQVTVSQDHIVVLDSDKNITMATLLPPAQSQHVQQQHLQQEQEQYVRLQSSSAPPAIPSDSDSENKGGQIRDRRSTRSLEALFKVTDSELQNMREDIPPTTSQNPVTIATGDQNFIVLNDLQIMDQGEGTQIIITTSDMPIGTMTGSDGNYYTISVPSSSSADQVSAQFTSSSSTGRGEMVKFVLQNENEMAVQHITSVGNQPAAQSELVKHADKAEGAAQKEKLVTASTPGRKRIHPQKPGKYKCKYCDRTCAKPSVLEKHLRAHTNERPFPCVVCGVSFKTKSNLSKHCKSNAHVNRTGLSWSGSKDGPSSESREEEAKLDKEDNDSEGTDTDVEGAGFVENDVDTCDGNSKVIAESVESSSTENGGQIYPGPVVRQESVLEGIRQKIEGKNKKQQQLEKEGKSEMNKWFLRVFAAFDKPSESELAKYEEAETLVRENILTMDNVSKATEILNGLEALKNEYSQQYPSTLPILMTHQFLTDDNIMVKILRPKAEYRVEWASQASTSAVPPVTVFENHSTSAVSVSVFENQSRQKVLPLNRISSVAAPPLVRSISSSLVPLSTEAYPGATMTDIQKGGNEERVRPQLTSLPSDVSVEHPSFESSSQRPRLFSHHSDFSVGSLRSVFSQSSKESALSSTSVDDPTVGGQKQLPGSSQVRSSCSPSRHPALGDLNDAAFSTIQDEKPTLVYQHAVDSDCDKMFKFQSRSLSSSFTSDMVKDRIQKIISTNAEIIDKHTLTEPPRPKNKYLRQASDSSFQTLKISDLRPSADVDRLTVETNSEKQWKKKLAASLSVGDTEGALLKPDLVQRSMSTSALRQFKTDSLDPGLINITPQTLIVTSGQVGSSSGKLQVPAIAHGISPQYQGEILVVQDTQSQHLQQQQQQVKYSVLTTPAAPQHLEIEGKTMSLTVPVSVMQKNIATEEQMSTASVTGLTQMQLDVLNSMQPSSAVIAAQLQSLNKAQLVCVPASSLARQLTLGDASLKLKPPEKNEEKPGSPHAAGIFRLHSVQDGKPKLVQLSEMSKSFSVTSSSFNSVSPSGGRVTIQDSQGSGLGNLLAKPVAQNISVAQTVPTSLPTKIVQGPGRNEIQIQIQLSKNANDQSVAHIQPPIQGATLLIPSATQKSTSDAPSIISSMLQAPRQLSPMIGQPGVQFPIRSRTDSPLLASKSFSGVSSTSKVSVASLMQTGSLDSTTHESAVAGKLKIGTSGSLHDQKKSMSRQGALTSSSSLSSASPQTKQPSFMTELQQRLTVPQNEPPTAEWKRETFANVMGAADPDKLSILTTEHFKSQGMSDGLAAAAGAYLLTSSFACEDCNESFQQESMRTQHRLLHCLKGKGLRRSLSAMEVAGTQDGENRNSASQSYSPAAGELLIVSSSEQLKKANPALLKSLSTTDLQMSVTKDLPKLREQLVLVASTSSSTLPVTSSVSIGPSQVPVTSSSSSSSSPPDSKQQKNLIIENINPSQPRKKGRPKGSKNRPKDLNLVLAKARGAQIPAQAIVTGTRQGSSAILEGSALKDPLVSTQTISTQNQVMLVPKLLLPRSGTVTTQAASAVTDITSAPVLSTPASSAVNQVLTTTATTINISMTSSNMIGQPMVPVVSSGKIVRQISSGLAAGTSAAAKAAIGPALIGLSPGVPLPGLTITGTSSVSVLSPGTPISTMTSGTPKPGGFMIGFPVSGITPSIPGTPVTPLASSGTLGGKTVNIQGQEPNSFTSDAPKLSSGHGLTLNIASAQSASSSQFSQMSPRVIPFIPAVTFHNLDPTSKLAGSLSVASPLPEQKLPQQQPQLRMPHLTAYTLTSAGPSTPSTPLTPATPDTPTDLSGTRRRLKDKLLMRQSLSVEKSQDRGSDKLLLVDSPAVTQAGFTLKANISDAPSIAALQPSMVVYQQGAKPNVTASNSVLLASLTKPAVSSQKLGSQPNAVITSAVMGHIREADKGTVDVYTRSESETHLNPDTIKTHPPVLRAFSEPAAAKKLKKPRQLRPSPLSVEGKNIQSSSRLISKMLSTPKSSQQAVSCSSEDLTSENSVSTDSKMESTAESFDSGLSLRSMSQETPFFFPKSASIASLDSNELLIDLSGDNFNNVTIPINYAAPFANVIRLQSGPLFNEWNHANRVTGSQVNLSPLTLAGSKIQLPAVGGSAMLQKEQKNWLLKRSLSLHRHFQILSRLWHSLSPVTLDSMTAMALAQGNPSPALLGRALLSYSSSSSSTSETPSTGTPGSVDPAKMKVAPTYPLSHDSLEQTKDEQPRQPLQKQWSGDNTTDLGSQVHSFHSDKAVHVSTGFQLKARHITGKESVDISTTPSSGDETQQQNTIHSSSHPLQLLTPVRCTAFGVNITSSLLSPSSISSAVISSVEQRLSSVTPSGTLNTPMYGHSCPTLYTTTHVTFCCIQRPQPMYVAVKGNKKISMYSNWRLATHNPNPVGLNSRMLLALYKSRNVSNPVYAQCSMTPSNGGNQTHSSYWTYQRKKMASVKKEVTGVKSEDTKANITVKSESGKDSKRNKLRLTKGGFKSNEKYEYIRGRGWGKYICEICGIRCKKPSMLKKHLRTHTDLRPYHCRHCKFSFKTKGNLTKHMKSKSHQKKCFELGIVPVPTAVDDSQIDPAALEEQCRISREAHIHDSIDAQMASGDEDDDEDVDGEEEDGNEDEEEEDDSLSKEDGDEQSFDQERSGSSSPRVLKRQSSVDEPSPVFSFDQSQKTRPFLGQMGSRSRNREISESSNISYSSQSSMENRAVSPHNIDTEIARSLLDLSQPRRSESREIVDEDARRHALTHLQSLITQLMAQKKPLSGLNLAGDSTSPSSGKLMASSLDPTGDGMVRRIPSLSSISSLDATVVGSPQPETQEGQLHPLAEESLARRFGLGTTSGENNKQRAVSEFQSQGLSKEQMGVIPSDSLHGNVLQTGRRSMEELFVFTDEKHTRKSDTSREYSSADQKDSALSPSSQTTVVSSSSQPTPTRPTHLSLLQAPVSPTKQQNSNLPSPSLFAFLPPYVSSRHAQRGRVSRTSDQGPIIGQFVRKDSQSISTPNVALTPNIVLAGQSQPFQFNIPFPGAGMGSGSTDPDSAVTPSTAPAPSKGFIHTIPIVTITSCETPSPTVDSPTIQDYEDRLQASLAPSAASSSSSQELTAAASSECSSDPNKTTSTMSSAGTTSVLSISSVKSLVRPTLESQGRSSSESATTLPKHRDGAIESLIRESAMPVLLVTGTEYSEGSPGLISKSSVAQMSSHSPNNQIENSIDPVGYPAGRRSRRLSSGKSRFLCRQRSLADDTAFPLVEEDSVFDSARAPGLEHSSLQQQGGKVTNTKETAEKDSEFIKSSALQTQAVTNNKDSAPPTRTTSMNFDIKATESSSSKDSPASDKEKEFMNAKRNACAFCSENFDSVEGYTAHLQSRKHISILETLGMLPAGTYEKLQQSEQQETVREEVEKERLKKEPEEGAVHDEETTSTASNNVSDKLADEATLFEADSGNKEEETDTVKMESDETALTSDTSLMIGSHTLQGSASPGSGASMASQRTSQKRKIPHQPVTESATLLITPHLDENLRQSLAKRARVGLANSLSQSAESEADLDSPLVIDEPAKGPAVYASTLLSLLASVKATSGLVTTTPTASLNNTVALAATAPAAVTSTQMLLTSSRTENANFMNEMPCYVQKSGLISHARDKASPDVMQMSARMEVDEERSPVLTGAEAKPSSPLPGLGLLGPGLPGPPMQTSLGKTSQQASAPGVAVSLPVSASLSYSLSVPGVTQIQMPIMTNAELRPYVCEFCDAGFTNERSLRTHLLTHGQDRPYICGNCGDTFALWQDRELHYSSHSSTSIRQLQSQDIRIQTTQPMSSVILQSQQSHTRKEDTASANQNAGISFTTTTSTNQNAGTSVGLNKNMGITFASCQKDEDAFSIIQNVATSANEALVQKPNLLMLVAGDIKTSFPSAINSGTPQVNYNKPSQVDSSENVLRGKNISDLVQNSSKQPEQHSSLGLDVNINSMDTVKSSADSRMAGQSSPVIRNATQQNLAYTDSVVLSHVTHQGLGLNQDAIWHSVARMNSKQELELEATRGINSSQSANDNSRSAGEMIMNEVAKEEVRKEHEMLQVYAGKNFLEGNQQAIHKMNVDSQSMSGREEMNRRLVQGSVGSNQAAVTEADKYAQGDAQTFDPDHHLQQQQQNMKDNQANQLGQATFPFQLSQKGFHQHQHRYFPPQVQSQYLAGQQNFPSGPGCRLTQETNTISYITGKSFDNVATGSAQVESLSVRAHTEDNSTNWNQISMRTGTDMFHFNQGPENSEDSRNIGNIDSQETMVCQSGQNIRNFTPTSSDISVAYKTSYSDASGHDTSMEYQSGYNADNTHGFTPCEAEQDNEEQNGDPILFPQTYYGLS